MDQADLEKLWAITIPVAPLDSSSPEQTYKPPLESAGTVFVAPPTDSDSGGGSSDSTAALSFPGVSAHVNLVGPDSAPEDLARSAGYELREVIGQGGMGVVYRARQASLQRDVAIKTIKERGKGEPKFVSEARATGQLDHPNIVPVYDLGATANGETILAMKLVEGASWKQILKPKSAESQERAARYELEDHLETLVQVANAVSFAHSRNLVHCDLKPENVMLGDFGEVLVMDWGLAVDVSDEPDADSTLVHRSAVKAPCGTPAYMPPELAAGEGDRITERTDVYLLGAILVELLTGKPPHTGKKLSAVIYQAYLSHPPELGDVPEELRLIARKALARLPEDRFASVAEFRDAVRGFIKHRESLVISDAARKRLQRAESAATSDTAYEDYSAAIAGFEHARVLWEENEAARTGLTEARTAFAESALSHLDLRLAEAQLAQLPRGEAAAALAGRVHAAQEQRARETRQALVLRFALAGAVGAIVIGLAIGFVLVRGARDEAVANAARAETNAAEALSQFERAEGETARATEAQGRAERELAGALIAQGTMLMTRERYVRARETFLRAEALSAQTGLPTLAAEIGRWEAERYAPNPLQRFPAPSRVTATAADEETVWVGCEDGTLLEYDLLRGHERSRRQVYGGAITALHVWRDTLLVGHGDGTLRSFVGNEERFSVEAHEGAILQLATYEFTRDDHSVHVVSAGEDAKIKVWDLEASGEHLHTIEHPGGPPPDLTVSWGGVGYTGSNDGSLHCWSYWRGSNWQTYPPQFTGLKSIRTAADSRWQPPDLRDPQLPQLATATAGQITLWEWVSKTRDFRPGKTLSGHRAPIEDLLWTRDGEHLVSVGSDGELRVWTRLGEQVRLLDGVGRGPLILTPRGFWLITREETEAGSAVLAWDLGLADREPTGAQLAASTLILQIEPDTPPPLEGPAPVPPPVTAVALDPEGVWVAGGTADGGVHLFDAFSGRPVDTLRGHAGPIRGLRFAPPDASGSPRVLSCGADGVVREWKLTDTTGLPVSSWRTQLEEVSAVAWTPDGVLVGDSSGRVVRLRERLDEEPLRSEFGPAEAGVGALAVNAASVVAGCADGTVLGWGAGGAPAFRFQHPEPISALAIDEAGTSLLVGDSMGGIVIYALPSGERTVSLDAHSARVTALHFLGEGGAISVGDDGRACMWSLETQRESYLSPPAGPLADIAVSLEPLRVASASEQGVLLWNMRLIQGEPKPGESLRETGERYVRRKSLRSGLTLLEEARAQGAPVSPLTLVRAYWELGYPLAGSRTLAAMPEGERGVEHQILARAIERAAHSGSLLGYSGGRTRALTPLEDERMLSAGQDGEYQEWDLTSGARLASWGVRIGGRNLYAVSVSPDLRRIVGRDAWSEIRIWDRQQRLLRQFKHKDATRTIALDDGILILTKAGAERIGYDGAPQKAYSLGLEARDRIEAFALAREADRFAIALRSKQIRVLRLSDGELLHTFEPPEGKVPDGLRFVRGGEALFSWRHARAEVLGLDGSVLKEFPVGRESVYVAEVDPQGQRIGCVDRMGFVRVWDVESGAAVVSTQIDEFPMRVGFNRAGTTFVVGTMRGTMIAFPVPERE